MPSGECSALPAAPVQDNLKRAEAAGLAWPLGAEITDAILEQRLFTRAGVRPGVRRRVEPDWSSLLREAKRPGVNLMVLWEEYREVHPDGYGYSRFCDLFREFERRLSPVMRQHHAAGDKVFVDYSGKKVPIVDPDTGVVREAEIFVAVLGASSLTYAEATWSQALPDWIGAHVRLFRFLRRAAPHRARQPEERHPQGLVLRPRDQPQLRHDGGPLRRRRAAGETAEAARQSQGRGRGPLRPDLHPRPAATADVLLARRGQRRDRRAMERINAHVMRRLGVSRRELFESIERPALRPLPSDDYEYAEWRLARVNLDYHVEAAGFLYSVPHALIRQQVDVRLTGRTVEIFHRGRRVAAHERRHGGRRHGTDPDHMPSSHRRYAEWTPWPLPALGPLDRAEHRGLVIAVLSARPHPEQGFRTCLGILRLFRGLDPARAEAVSARLSRSARSPTRASPPSSPTTSIAPSASPRPRR